MKAKISRGSGFRGLLNYLYGPGEDNHPGRAVPVIGAGNVLGFDPRDLAREFAVSRLIRPDIKKPVWHCSLSLPPGEKLPDEGWAEITRDFLARMGLDPDARMWHCVRHIDTDHDHIHLVVSRVGLDATVWHGKNDVRQAIQVTQEMEKAHGLKLTPGFDEGGEQKSLLKAEVGRYRRTGKVPDRLVLQKKIEAVRKDCPDFPTFVAKCREQEILIIPNGKSGQVGGVSFRLAGGDPFSGSSLGKAYKWQRIAEDTHFDAEKDAELIAQMRKEADEAQEAGSIGPAGPETTENQKVHRARGQIDPGKERDRYFVRAEDGSWSWKKHPERAAFRMEGEQVTVLSRQDVAIRAVLLTAAESFGSPLQIHGEDEFRRKAWLAGSKMGLKIEGYEPTVDDLAELTVWPAQQNKEVQPGYTLPEEVAQHEPDSEHDGRNQVPDGSGTSRDSRGNTTTLEAGGDAGSSGRGDTAAVAADSGTGRRDIEVAAGPADAGGPGDRDADRAVASATRKSDGSRDGDPQSHGVPGRSGGGVAGRDRRVQSGSRADDSLREGRAAGGREIHAAAGDADGAGRGQRAGSNTPGPVTDPDGTPVLRHVPPRDVADLSDFGWHFRTCLAAESARSNDDQGGGDVPLDLVPSDRPGKTPDREDHLPAPGTASDAAVAAGDHPPAPEAEPTDAEKSRPQQQRKSPSPRG